MGTASLLTFTIPFTLNLESEVVDFCKLGCASSVCSTMSTLSGNEEANYAVDRCNDACHRFCTKEAETVTVVS
uniref:Acidic protein n=1 Tax=Oryza glumipatula TaxID=40148 RepID=A0A0E0AA86_9ORYZ